ncbi:hypothetical protein GCM10011375_04030 [Hymenobacter qilianensis]|uniref:Uncharacterized protein n=2 Tax=Hymenobacter qilianensis TaxID=1385715 RepID=A0ACB5PLZ8_9BACT|nr:hypothetical protein [Hymenobacter qilianensis]QNP53943.1 hypothetical protein H9L05_10685 [Hymenobacter qilianensis]GGF51758.1 hypothetical protein GCM10011375_04030 [Hymenobacter qilianensis]
MKRYLTLLLAAIGAFTILKFFYDTYRLQKDATGYLASCEKVKVGMTLEEAKKIMGDYNYYERANRSEIWTFYNNEKTKQYFLTYPAPFAASEGTWIHFDPETQLVIGVTCGEK